MKKNFLLIFTGAAFFIAGFLFFVIASFHLSKPVAGDRISVKGIGGKVEILTDRWGIPHVFAQNEEDLFFACGFLHAKERMWQMELQRRAGSGRLSEILGKEALDRDRFLRNLGLKEAALRSYEKLSAEEGRLIAAYSRGVNFWMRSRGWSWPPEFLILRFRPEPWHPIDSLFVKEVMSLLLCVDYPSELIRGNLAKRMGSDKALQILEEEVKEIPDEIGESSLAKLSEVLFTGGSNNWVVSGNLTKSGKPLLANDPHLQISTPPIWYEMHLQCPTLNVAGASIPGIPFVVIGHNDFIAWGVTNSGVDVQDLYIEKIDTAQEMYLGREGWKPLRKTEEVFHVRGRKEPDRMAICWTERGPIISPEIVESLTPVSLRWCIHDGGREFKAFFKLNKARNWDEFREALSFYSAPSQNIVYADIEGNIGYWLMGKIPLRDENSALFPFPGWLEKGHWKGFLEEERKAYIYNPPGGIIVTANNRILPESFPHYLSVDWDMPFRADRIRELLLLEERHDIASFQKIQSDVYAKNGEMFFQVLQELQTEQGESEQALEILRSWDRLMSSGKAPLLYKTFLDIFSEETLKDELGEDFRSFDFLFRRKNAGLMRILSDPESPWFDRKDTPRVEDRSDIVKLSLKRAMIRLRREYGPPEKWDWKTIHSLRYEHLLGRVAIFRFLNRGPYPLSGDAFTVNSTYALGNHTTHGPSYRQIVDLADIEKSVCVITSGQSGHFLSRYYDNQIPLWLKGQYHPMLFERKDVEVDAQGRLLLMPSFSK
ncbi:MAG: penicillin acylase family protein [Candidatus Aminicenantes bacterium]|nr:penicillin acylase family protein [Candidatus Aminicenantes bacterium]